MTEEQTEINKKTLLFVEENESILSRKLIAREDLKLVLLRFANSMHFTTEHLDLTNSIPSFMLDKERDVLEEVDRFRGFCSENTIDIDYFHNDSEFNQEKVQEFARLLGLGGALSYEQALWVRDKAAMKEKVRELGYRTVSYAELAVKDDADSFAQENGGYPIIVKWRKGLSSKEVYKVESLEDLNELELDYSKGRFIAETYCPHLIWCVDALIQEGTVLQTFLTWLPYTNLSFAEKKERFAQITLDYIPEEVGFDGGTIVQDIVSSIDLRDGYIHLETFVEPSGEPIICEFAWRTAGEHMLSNHSLAFGIDVYDLLIDIMIRKKAHISITGDTMCIGDMFLPLSEGEVTNVSSYDELKSVDGVIDGEVKYIQGDVVKSKRQYTDSAGWIQVSGKTKEEVLSRMLKVYERFKLETV